MAEEDTTPTAPGLDYSQLPALLEKLGLTPPAPVQQSGQQGVGGVGGFLGDVGKALAGGGSGLLNLSPGDSDKAGAHALLNAGINMLMASGPSYVPRNLGQIIGYGLQGAQEGYQGTEVATAERLAAQQGGQQQQYENRLKAIKEALPILTTEYQQRLLAEQRRSALGQTAGSGRPNTSISAAAAVPAYGGAVNAPPMPPEYEQHFQDASKATGVPVAVLKAMATQESGFNPNAANGGIMQITDATATKPGYGMQGVRNPAELRDPRSNIMFGAQYLAARAKDLGVDLNTPDGQAAALKAYNGGGDPKYVNKVFSYMPPGGGWGGTQVAAATSPSAAPAAATPPGRVQVAKADTGTVTDGTTAPAAAEPVENYTDPTKPFLYKAAPIPEGVVPSGDLSPDEKAAVLARKTANSSRIADINSQLRVEADAPTIAKLREEKRNLGADNATADQEAAKAKAERTTAAQAVVNKFNQDDYAQKKARYEAAIKAQQDAALEKQKGDQQLAQTTAQGEQQRLSNAEQARLDANKHIQNKVDEDALAAKNSITDLDMMRQLNANLNVPATGLADITIGGRSALDWLTSSGFGTQAAREKWGAAQTLQAGLTAAVRAARSGTLSGSTSDADLRFLQGMGPRLTQDPETREAVINYLDHLQRYKQKYSIEFSKALSEPGVSAGRAAEVAETKAGEVIPKAPADFMTVPVDAAKKWLEDNVQPNTYYHRPDGKLALYRDPNLPPLQRK